MAGRVDAQLLFGPILLGVFLNCILYGALAVQAFVYFQSYKGDARWLKMFVAYLLVCETLNTIFDISMMYEPLVIRYGTPRATVIAPIMLTSDPVLTVMISLPVQFFIAWRVKIMSKSKLIPVIIVLCAIVAFVGGIATGISVAFINRYADFHKFYAAPITWLAASASADVIITVTLVYNLSHRRTGFPSTDDLINRIIRLTVQTGLITSLFAWLDIALFLAYRGTTLNFVWDLALSKLYSNALLSTLNARGGWRVPTSTGDNVLFGEGADEESVSRCHAQVEIIPIRPQTERPPITVHAKVEGLGARANSETTTCVPKFLGEV